MKFAIIENNAQDAERFTEYLNRFSKENRLCIEYEVFTDGITFLVKYKPIFDCVFFDIDLPHMSGIECATKFRQTNSTLPIVYVTSFGNYALDSYKTKAVDYLLKPYTYASFEMTMMEVVKSVSKNVDIAIRNRNGAYRVSVSSILYIEMFRHYLIYHTDSGTIQVFGSMSQIVDQMKAFGFARCGASYLVNIRHIRAIEGTDVFVGDERLKISRAKKAEFIAAVNTFKQGNF